MHIPTLQEKQEYRTKLEKSERESKTYTLKLSSGNVSMILDMIKYRRHLTDMYWTTAIDLEELENEIRRQRREQSTT